MAVVTPKWRALLIAEVAAAFAIPGFYLVTAMLFAPYFLYGLVAGTDSTLPQMAVHVPNRVLPVVMVAGLIGGGAGLYAVATLTRLATQDSRPPPKAITLRICLGLGVLALAVPFLLTRPVFPGSYVVWAALPLAVVAHLLYLNRRTLEEERGRD